MVMALSAGGDFETIYTFNTLDAVKTTLDGGLGAEVLADHLIEGGGPVKFIKPHWTTTGTVGTFARIQGTGVGTLVGAAAAHKQVKIFISTAGTLGTAKFRYKVGSNVYSAEIATTGPGPFIYQVPGTLVSLSFAAGTYVLSDEYTFNTDGTSVQGAITITATGNPVDDYLMRVKITKSGANGVAKFQYSLDQGINYSPEIITPAAGLFVVPDTGVYITFGGTQTVDDIFAATILPPRVSNTDITNAFAVIIANPLSVFGFLHLAGYAGSSVNAANAASAAGVLDTQLAALETTYKRYMWGFVEVPMGESDSTILTAFASFVSNRVGFAYGDCLLVSALTGRSMRRNAGWPWGSRECAIQEGVKAGWVGQGALARVQADPVTNQLYFNQFTAATDFDGARFTTLRTVPGQIGTFITRGRLGANLGSDFSFDEARRVMDRAATVVQEVLSQQVQGSVRVDRDTGFILEEDAVTIESRAENAVRADLLSRGQISDVTVRIKRDDNILSTSTMNVEIAILPLAYSDFIVATFGFINPALEAAS